MADIFISYSRKDRARVERLVDALTAEGYEVWWDLEIRAGESFDRLIENTLKRVRCVVAVWSRQSVMSEWVRAESAWAIDRNRLVSIRIDEDLELPLKFCHLHTKGMTDWEGGREARAFQELVADIRKIAGPSPAPALAPSTELPKPPPEAPPNQESSPASDMTPAPRPKTERAPQPEPQPAPPVSSTAPKSHGVAVGMISLAIAALIGGVVFFDTQDQPDRGDELGASDVGRDQSKSTPPQVADDIRKDGALYPEMVIIPAGNFRMGCVSGKGCSDNELPVRTVTFDEPFAMGKYEVTFAEYDRFAEATGRKKPGDAGWGRGKRPVIYVGWDDAQAYASWLSEQTGKRYRLPTEAEWEYAARGGMEAPFSTDECIDTEQANYNGNYGWRDCPETGVYRRETLEVGSLPANPWGLHEVHGNVWEWAADCWHVSYEGAPTDDPAWEQEGGGDCGRRVLRGGSWGLKPGFLRSAARGWTDAGIRGSDLGFRLAQDL